MKNNGLYMPKVIFKKFINLGEALINKFPLRKIGPGIKKIKNGGKNFLGIIFFVIKFVKTLQEKTFVKKYQNLTAFHFELINDKARTTISSSGLFNNQFTLKDGCFVQKKVFY